MFHENISLTEAINFGKEGKDDGLYGVFLVTPTNDNCQMWLQYYGYLQMMFELCDLPQN